MVYLFVGIGGIFGSLLRFIVSAAAHSFWNDGFPAGTLFINLSGAFFLGWVTSHLITPERLHPTILTALSTGVIGSYTTFSTLSVETVQLLDSGNYLSGAVYVAASIAGGLLFAHLGMQLGNRREDSGRKRS